MKKLFLCGHTGSDNRGCEAIVRSTIDLFNNLGFKEKPVLATFSLAQDAKFEESATLVPYKTYSSKLERAWYAVKRKIFKVPFAGQEKVQKELWQGQEKGDLSLTVGGDTYCYSPPTVSMAQNLQATKRGITSVLWCCSLEKTSFNGTMLEDINRYDLIVARECETVQNLKAAGVKENKIVHCCDPAFTLKVKQTTLPKNFESGNMVGINLSNLVDTPEVFEATVFLAEKILKETNMKICLVPHVYNSEKGTGDLVILKKLFDRLRSFEDRVCMVTEDLSCTELKFIISNCRFFIGARTHSIVASYSTGVPALALGYSVKSVGIAKDIFGTSENYVLSYKNVKEKEDIYRNFAFVMDNEEAIRAHYKKVMPQYKSTVTQVVENIIERYLK